MLPSGTIGLSKRKTTRPLNGIRLAQACLPTMAFEASTLVNGEWTTRTLDVNTVLRHYDQQDEEAAANAIEIDSSPVLGLLTQTVIRSPVVHWILPAKLRDSNTNDVAFIGVRYVSFFACGLSCKCLFFVLRKRMLHNIYPSVEFLPRELLSRSRADANDFFIHFVLLTVKDRVG